MLVLRRTTLGGLAAMVLAPIAVYFAGYPAEVIAGATVVSGLVLFGHRSNLREAFGGEPVLKEDSDLPLQDSDQGEEK